MFDVAGLLGFLLPALPLALIWAGGVVWAVSTLHRHQAVSLLAFLACSLLLLNVLGGGLLTHWLIQSRSSQNWSTAQVGAYLGTLNLVRSVVSALGYLLLLVAVFGWRVPPVRRSERRELEVDDSRPSSGPQDAIRTPGRTL